MTRADEAGGEHMSDLDAWGSFYVILGSAAGALIGLQFVVVTLVAERPSLRAAEAGAAFATPTIIHFSTVLLLSALIRVPWPTITLVVVLWGLLGLSGLAYEIAVFRFLRRQAVYQLDVEDWILQFLLPLAAIRIAPGSGTRGNLLHTRSVVYCWSGSVAATLRRYSQRLGQHCLPCIRRPGDQ